MAVRERDNGAKALMRRMKNKATVKVGIIGGGEGKANDAKKGAKGGLTVVDVATFHEFGLGKNPPRPFISQPIDRNESALRKKLRRVAENVAKGQPLEQALDQFGGHVVGLMQQAIANREYKELSEARKKQKIVNGKSGNTPLIDTEQLRSSITYETQVSRRA